MYLISRQRLLVLSLIALLTPKVVSSTNITLISFTATTTDIDGFIPLNPAYDIVIQRLKAADPVTLANFHHIPVRCRNDYLIIGNATTATDFVPASSAEDTYEDFMGACVFRFYYSRPELFTRTRLDQKFTIITTPSISDATAELALQMSEILAMLALAMPDNRLADIARYPTTLNVFGSPDESFPFSLSVLARSFNWTNGVDLVCGQRDEISFVQYHCEMFGSYTEDYHNRAFRNLPFDRYYIKYSPTAIVQGVVNTTGQPPVNFDAVFASLGKRRCTLLLLVPSVVRDFLIQAYYRNLTRGDYVFVTFAVQGSPSQNDIFWKADDENDTIAAKAFRSLLIIQEANATDWNGSDIFVNELYDQYRSRYPNWMMSYSRDIAISLAVKILEWMTIIAMNIKTADLSTASYEDFVRGCTNKTYDLPTRQVIINSRGTLVIPTVVYRLDDDRVFKPFITVDYRASTAAFVATPNWFGMSDIPGEIPACGLRNECADEADTGHVVLFCVGTIAICLFCHFLQRYVRRKLLQSRLSDLLIERSQIAVLEDPGSATLGSANIPNSPNCPIKEIGLRFKQRQKNIAMPKHNMLLVPLDVSKLSYSTGRLGQPAVYRDRDIFLKVLSDGQSMGDLIRNTKFCNSVVQASRLRHTYVAEFIGICHDRSLISAIFERPAKGSLKMLLEDNVFFHDLDRRLTLFANLVEGLHYIHTTGLKYHGSLSSDFCLINSRYTIRIAMAGLHHLAAQLDHNHRRNLLRNMCSSGDLTTTLDYQKNDMEQLGVIIREMFETAISESMTKLPILISIQQLAASCSDPDPNMRPSAAEAYRKTKVLGIGRQSAVELLMSRLQKHAEQLEHEVALRSEALATEMKKVDLLLNEMLPKPVIEKLRNHIPIIPELYDSATVLFSDIPVFSRLVAECTPMEVVFFLSQIHSEFDEIVSGLDAYKVETINDSYVVVSGIPNRNEKHATIICRLAQRLLIAGGSISIPALGDVIASPRIGINSGLAVAGVIGTRMPRYCLFGDTVNTASRMESHGAANRIHVSAATRDLVLSREDVAEFEFVSRGITAIKGKGSIETFWLRGEKKIELDNNTECSLQHVLSIPASTLVTCG